MEYTLQLISNKPDSFAHIQKSLYPEKLNYFNGVGYSSFAKLVNSAVTASPTETVIIMSDRVRPTQLHVQKTIELLDKGYALVGLGRFAFFGFKKEVLRRIGMFDERHCDGGHEDIDFIIRLREHDLGIFLDDVVPYHPGESRWGHVKSYKHFIDKWNPSPIDRNLEYKKIQRRLSEETYDYDLGPSVPTTFLPCKMYSYIYSSSLAPLITMEFSTTSYSLQLISNKPDAFDPIQKRLYPEKLNYFDGTGYPSFSKLVNDAVTAAPTETVIILSDKVRPTPEHIKRILKLLDDGYGLASLFSFALFGFKKELLRRIGMFDERYVGGGNEDYDFTLRLIESNIAMYMINDCPFFPSASRWSYNKSQDHYFEKWKHHWVEKPKTTSLIERTISEEKYNYDLGPSVPTTFLPCREHSRVTIHYLSGFFTVPIK